MKLDYSAVPTMADGRTAGEYIQGIEAYWCIARVGLPELISRRGVSSRGVSSRPRKPRFGDS